MNNWGLLNASSFSRTAEITSLKTLQSEELQNKLFSSSWIHVVVFIFFPGIEESRTFSMRIMLMIKANNHTFLICECLALF